MQEVDVEGLRIAYDRAGTGAPLILLHGGFGFDRRSWGRQFEDLSDRFDLVAWDAPGCGRSADPPEGFGMGGYADCLAAFVGRLGLGRAHVLGLSFGAALALELYRRHPSVPRSLILAGAYAGWAGSLPPDEVERRVARVLAERDLPPERWIPDYLPGMLTETAPPDMVAEVAALMSDVRTVGNTAMLLAMAACDLRDVLPRIAVPTLLLYGDVDRRSPLSIGEALHTAIAGSQLVVLPGVGHLSNIEAPAEFNDEVRRFLATQDERALPGSERHGRTE